MADDASMTYEEHQLAMYLLGPWLVGSFLELFLQGVLFCQFSTYFTWHHNDKPGVRLTVGGLALLTTLKSIQSFVAVWIIFINHFKDLNGAALLNYTAWWQTGNGLMVASIGLYVQIFFCHRLWVISSKNYWFVTPVGTILTFGYISICLATYYISEGAAAGQKIGMWFAAHLSSVFAGDMIITLSTSYFLIKTKKEVLPQTVGIISSLIRLTFQTAAPAAICAMFNLIFSQVYSGDNNLVSAGFNQVLPKLYAVSMMWTLNARRTIRLGRERMFSDEHSSARRRENSHMELASYNNHGVRVRTQTEVTRHIDFKQPGEDVKTHPEEFKMAV